MGFGTLATYHNQRASGGPTIITTMQIRSMICISFLTCAPLRDLPIFAQRSKFECIENGYNLTRKKKKDKMRSGAMP